jgi:hypothetical protein
VADQKYLNDAQAFDPDSIGTVRGDGAYRYIETFRKFSHSRTFNSRGSLLFLHAAVDKEDHESIIKFVQLEVAVVLLC